MDRDLILSEAQEKVEVARWHHQDGTVGGPDSFYNGVRHAAAIIRDMREGDPSALAFEAADLRRKVEELEHELEEERNR